MTDAPQPSPAPVSANSRLLGLAALALIALVVALFWRRAAGAPDTARIDAACVVARPHFAAFQRCLLGAPLARGEKPAQRLRNIVLANQTLPPDAAWPRRCAPHAQATLTALTPVRSEDPRIDQVVAALWSSRVALSRGRAPTGVDALWAAAERVSITGTVAPATIVPARAPLHPLTGAEATAAVLGPRLERVLAVEAGRLLLAGETVRLCRVDGARVACSQGPATSRTVGYTLVPGAAPSASARPADLVLARTHDAPERLLDAAAWTEVAVLPKIYGAFAQRGGALALRASEQPRDPLTTTVLVENMPAGAAPGAELRVPFSLVLAPRVEAGFAYYAYADLRPRPASAAATGDRPPRVGVAWLPDDALAVRPPPEDVPLPTLPVQVLGCALGAGRALAFITAVPTDGDEVLPRAVETHLYDERGVRTGIVRGELAGTGATIDCLGDAVAFLARRQLVVGDRRAIALSGLRCTSSGCEGSAATLSPMNDVPDAITLSDGRVLVVYRTAAAGGLRARIAPLAELATARELVLSDEAGYGGIESAHRWLVRDGDRALLVLATRAGVVALSVAPDGAVTLLRR
jgi:hypothetical protein